MMILMPFPRLLVCHVIFHAQDKARVKAEAAAKAQQRAAVAIKTKAVEYFLRAQQPLPKIRNDAEESSVFWSHLASNLASTGEANPGVVHRTKMGKTDGNGAGRGVTLHSPVDTGAECLEVVKLWAEKLPPI